MLLAIAIWLVVLVLKRYRRSLHAPRPQGGTPTGDMVRCAKCGVFLPKAESVLKGGAYYCCEEHSRSDAA